MGNTLQQHAGKWDVSFGGDDLIQTHIFAIAE
jgi:hypothetical protein